MSGIIPKEHIIKVHGLNFRFLHDFEIIFAGDFRCLDYHPESGRVLIEPVVSVVLGHQAGALGVFLRPVGEEQPIAIMAPPADLLQADATKPFENCRHERIELMIEEGMVSEYCTECKAFRRQGQVKVFQFQGAGTDPLKCTRIEIDWSL